MTSYITTDADMKVAVQFADLHDTPGRMEARGAVRKVVPWVESRSFFYWRLRRRLAEFDLRRQVRVRARVDSVTMERTNLTVYTTAYYYSPFYYFFEYKSWLTPPPPSRFPLEACSSSPVPFPDCSAPLAFFLFFFVDVDFFLWSPAIFLQVLLLSIDFDMYRSLFFSPSFPPSFSFFSPLFVVYYFSIPTNTVRLYFLDFPRRSIVMFNARSVLFFSFWIFFSRFEKSIFFLPVWNLYFFLFTCNLIFAGF